MRPDSKEDRSGYRHWDWYIVQLLCKVLKEVGTAHSNVALQTACNPLPGLSVKTAVSSAGTRRQQRESTAPEIVL